MLHSNIIERIKLPFRKEKELYSYFYKILGFYPKNISLYKQALLHKSSSIKSEEGKWINNERLEFLGDAILDAIVGDVVFRRFEGKREGFLTNARSKIVQRETLNKLAIDIGLDKLIKFSSHSTTSHNSNMCGNAFEALVGAIYLDYGYNHCMRFMKNRILEHLISVDKMAYKEVNFKSKLIEWSQKNKMILDFKLVDQKAIEGNSPVFYTQVEIENIKCGSGKGYSKKESQQVAAKETLEMLKKQTFIESIFSAKSQRTAMEENPQCMVPETFVAQETAVTEQDDAESGSQPKTEQENILDFDLSDIKVSSKKLSKEEIIAAAEAAAFKETQQ